MPHFFKHPTSLTAAAVLLLACILPARASDDPPAPTTPPPASTPVPLAVAPVEIPDTPAGRALAKFLVAFTIDTFPLTTADFSPAFLQQVPLEQIEKLTADLRAKSGSLMLKSIEPGATETRLIAIARATKGKGAFRIPVAVDDRGRIEGLRISPAPDTDIPALKSWEDLDARLKPMAESVAVAAYSFAPTGGKWPPTLLLDPIHELNAGRSLAVGSTFKLYVLIALAAKIDRGEAAWETELAIDDKIKSLPSGVMQNEKDGTKFPIKQFALKMISISDNTATDHLMHFVGREAIEVVFLNPAFEKFGGVTWHPDDDHPLDIELARRETLPFLTTREMFALKLAQDRTLVERYAKAPVADRRAMLAPAPADPKIEAKAGEVYSTQPSLAMVSFWLKPVAIDQVEWFVSTREACTAMLMLDLMRQSRERDLTPLGDILGANPGIPLNPKVWKRFFYKGGSEPGVLNLTWLLERDDGMTFTLSITLNDTKKPIAQDDAIGLAARAIELLEKEGRK